ncbi:MAG: sulfatase-like hydrolase/transferase [Candidatus Acidiferrales bacterium]
MNSAQPSGSTHGQSRWISGARYVIAWFVPAFLCILTKLLTLANGRGFRVVARYLGRVEGTGFPGLTIAERLTFFRSEILWLFLIVPFVLLMVLHYLTRIWRLIFMAVICFAASLVVFVQARSLEEVGDFVSFAMFRVALSWGIHDPGANKSYLFTREFYILLGALAVLTAILVWAAYKDKNSAASVRHAEIWRDAASVYVAGTIMLAGLAWWPRIPGTPYHENILVRSLAALWAPGAINTREFEALTLDQLSARYREMVNAPPVLPESPYFGSMRGANLIVLALETEPARFLSSEDPLTELPTLRRLESNSFIATQHFTTYPYTNQALFSAFASSYPLDGTHTFAEEHPDAIAPGLPTVLRAHEYATALYLPSPQHGDAAVETFRGFGFSQEVSPDPNEFKARWPAGLSPDWKAERVARDLAVLDDGKRDIEHWLSSGQPFFAAFAFQISHLPYPDGFPDDATVGIAARNRRILVREDAWLGEIVALLEQHNQLKNTVIAIFGDHGIRTQHEDPNFVGGTLDDYSFHVPMRIYAPKALEAPLKINWLTSHIDIAPTLLDLLGVDRRRELEQGTAIWNPALAQRTTFFLARQTFGTDGYYSGLRYFMWNQLSDTVSASARLHFEIGDVLTANSKSAQDVIPRIRRFLSFEQVWLDKISQIRRLNN